MASGTLGADELPREKQKHKWTENCKVYTRKIFRSSGNKNTTNSNSTVLSKNQSNGENHGDKSILTSVKSNSDDNLVANDVVTGNRVEIKQDSNVAAVHDKGNSVEDVPGNGFSGREEPSNPNSADEVPNNLNNVEKLPVNAIDDPEGESHNATTVEKVPDKGNDVGDVPVNGNKVVEKPCNVIGTDEMLDSCGNGVELPDKENNLEDLPGRENTMDEVSDKENNLEELPDQENPIDEVPDKENNLEELPNQENTIDKVPDKENNLEELPDQENSIEEMRNKENNFEMLHNQENTIYEVLDKENNLEELPDQENTVAEVPVKENNLEEQPVQDNNIEKLPQKSPSPRLPVEEGTSSQPGQSSSRIDRVTLSEDSLSLNRGERHLTNGHGHDDNLVSREVREERPLVTQSHDRLVIRFSSSKSKEEFRVLKRKLEDDLTQVRKMARRLEAKENELNSVDFNSERYQEFPVVGRVQSPANDGLENDFRSMRGNLESGTVGFSEPRPFRRLAIPVMDISSHGVGEIAGVKEKRTPKANQYYRNSDFLLGKDKLPPESNRKSKSSGGGRKRGGGGETDYGFGVDKKIFKKCSDLLQKLRNHKHGWVFNQPVDVKRLGLHDYFDIIKRPMDLGTVEMRLANNWYKTPRDFAQDVRLTFHNAMIYNPDGQDVHIMAKELLRIFEERWSVIESDYDRKLKFEMMRDFGTPTPTSRKTYAPAHLPIHIPLPPPPLLQAAPTFHETRNFERSQSMPVRPEARPKPTYSVGRIPAPKKPKAKDPDKRDMTFEEKQKLSTNLQGLPSEKLDALVQIIKKRNSALSQHDDEIEVDIDSVDTETLWELDRFVTNYKKSLSKHKRKAEIAMQARAAAAQAAQQTMPPAPVNNEAPREDRAVDEGNVAAAPPHTQVEKPSDNASDSSSSSSSSSDSGSSSSDSDSDSSSGSESEEDR